MTASVVLRRSNRAAWLRLRSQGLGGTDVAAVLGFSKFTTPLEVWLDKTGRGTETTSSYPMRRGTYMERFILDEYARDTGAIIERPPDLPALLAHPEHRWLRASLDGLAHHRDRTVIVDAKAPTWRGRADWWDEEKLCPDGYAVQMLVYLAVTGLDEAVLVADVAGELTTVTIARDLSWEQRAIPLLAQWWAEFVVADQPPPADWERDSIPALNRAWVPVPGETVEADPRISEFIARFRHIRTYRQQADRDESRLKVAMREYMRTAEVLTIDGATAAALDARNALRVKDPGSETPTRDQKKGSEQQ